MTGAGGYGAGVVLYPVALPLIYGRLRLAYPAYLILWVRPDAG
jgi:hypothetical protein